MELPGEGRYDIVEGSRQDPSAASHIAAIEIMMQPQLSRCSLKLLKASNAKLEAMGGPGCLVACADDTVTYLVGPPDTVVAAVLREHEEAFESIGTTLNKVKSALLLGAQCELPSDFPISPRIQCGRALAGYIGYGIVCAGVPVTVGEAQFITRDR